MALLQIAEPGESTAPHQHQLAVGIDLGTTNSLVAAVRSGVAETLPDAQGRHLLPSVVRYLADDCVVGDDAKSSSVKDPHNTVVSVKRMMGRGLSDIKSLGDRLPYEFDVADTTVPRIQTVNGSKSAIEISADILRVLKQRGEATLGGELEVPTLDGRVKLKIPPETQTGKLFRLRGKGVKPVRGGTVGDLLCRAVIETPVNLTKRQKELLEEFG